MLKLSDPIYLYACIRPTPPPNLVHSVFTVLVRFFAGVDCFGSLPQGVGDLFSPTVGLAAQRLTYASCMTHDGASWQPPLERRHGRRRRRDVLYGHGRPRR